MTTPHVGIVTLLLLIALSGVCGLGISRLTLYWGRKYRWSLWKIYGITFLMCMGTGIIIGILGIYTVVVFGW